MDKKELKAKDIPGGYALCFNSVCGKKDMCMHYQAQLLMPKNRCTGQAVYPTAWQDGECRCFCEKRDRAEARECVHSYFGRGNGPYYRVHHGENKLSPTQQADILNIVAKFAPIDGIKFDHYEMGWNFD